MNKVYIIILVVSAVMFTADMVLRYMEKISNFGIEEKLFKFKVKTIPLEDFFPHTISKLFLTMFVFGVYGLSLSLLKLRWYLSLPSTLIFSMIFCFILQYFLDNQWKRRKKKTAPRGEEAAGIEGFVLEAIPGNSYGVIEFEYNGETYQKNAISEYETDIPEFERVIILLEENDMYVVESIVEVYDIVSEEQ